jgi:hypothetical protein
MNSAPMLIVAPHGANYVDDISTEGMTYSSHFFIRMATLEMMCVGLPVCV